MAGSVAAALPLSNSDLGSIMTWASAPTTSLPPTVKLPTHTSPSHEQTVLGILSPFTTAVEEFRGIPYGVVPARWQHSLLRRSLPQDVFDASRHGPKCPQPGAPNNSGIYQSHLDFPDVGESETHCLNLFIVRPSATALLQAGLDPLTKLPVYFYIHGGGFGFGASTDPIWDPTRLVAQSLTLRKPFMAVLINYRLNLFGFAASSSIIAAQPESQLKGCNFGLADQRIALKWVSQNIASFGGDPNDITLGGQSAGGCSVNTHILEARSNPAPPLFRRAIVQSGALTSVGIGPMSLDDCDKRWNTLCEHFGIADQADSERFEFLRSLPPKDLVKAGWELGWMVFHLASDDLSITTSSGPEWLINFDYNRDVKEEVGLKSISRDPIKVLIGDTEEEGGVFIARALPKIESYEQTQSMFREAFGSDSEADVFLQTYGIVPGVSIKALHQSLTAFITDVTFGYSIHFAHRQLSGSSRGIRNPTTAQLYRVKFGNPFPGPNNDASHHCVDLIYLFDAFHDDLEACDKRSTDSAGLRPNSALREQMQSDWIDFIVGDFGDIREDSVLVYGKDRVARMGSLYDGVQREKQREKFDLIGRYRRETARIMGQVFSLSSF